MGTIYIDTDSHAPCCPCRIVDKETGKDILVQTDWDFPGFASTFGWSVRDVQKCRGCHATLPTPDYDSEFDDAPIKCDECGRKKFGKKGQNTICDHSGTDGTIDCKDCGVTASEFIESAREFLEENDGAEADDPGYFDNE
jgi:hypothetical protein